MTGPTNELVTDESVPRTIGRAYAIQRRHNIILRWTQEAGKPLVDDMIRSSAYELLRGIVVYSEKDASAMIGLSFLMELFYAIDEDRVNCWNDICEAAHGRCAKLDAQSIVTAHEKLTKAYDRASELCCRYDRLSLDDDADALPTTSAKNPSLGVLSGMGVFCHTSQFADIVVTQKWLQNRVWRMAFKHGLLSANSQCAELSYSYAVLLGESTLDICQSISLSAMEAHGIGLVCIITITDKTFCEVLCGILSSVATLIHMFIITDRKAIRHSYYRCYYAT